MTAQSGNGTIGDVARFVKRNKLISRGLGLFPNPAMQLASKGAAMIGLGKKKRRRVTRPRVVRPRVAARPRLVGNGIFSDIGGGIGNIFGGIGGGIGSVAHGLFGGRKRGKRAPRKTLVR